MTCIYCDNLAISGMDICISCLESDVSYAEYLENQED